MTEQVPITASVTVLGAGAWGTALAAAASRQSDVMLWGRNPDLMRRLAATQTNDTYLPDVRLPDSLRYEADLGTAFDHAMPSLDCPGLIILATPMAGLVEICRALCHRLGQGSPPAGVIWTCKGLTPDTAKLPHEVIEEQLSDWPSLPLGVLSGPSFAKEVARGLPVALTVASNNQDLRDLVTEVFHSDHMRIYGSSDLVGVEVGGALKNIMAIACGISDGLGLGDNARAALITRGLAEMSRFGAALGAQPATFFGLTGLGDLVLTATGNQSRNRQVGLQIGQGQSLDAILAGGLTAEGARCARAVQARARSLNISMPITDAVCDTLFNGVLPATAVARLMSRSATDE